MEYQKPSVGRIVHFNAQHGDYVSPEAALVVAVHSDITVTLHVFTIDGSRIERSIVFGSPEKAGTWCWPARV